MIGHQAPAQDVERALASPLLQLPKEVDAIAGGEEDRLPVVATLGDVMRKAGYHETR
jgi:hypothetical protein